MSTDHDPQAAMPDPTGSDVPGESPFASTMSPFAMPKARTIMSKLALVLSLAPWAAIGLSLVFQPG